MNTPHIREEAVDAFIALYKQEYGVELERSEALAQLQALIFITSQMLPESHYERITKYIKMYKEKMGEEIPREVAEVHVQEIIKGTLQSALSPKHRQELEHAIECRDDVFRQMLELFFTTVREE